MKTTSAGRKRAGEGGGERQPKANRKATRGQLGPALADAEGVLPAQGSRLVITLDRVVEAYCGRPVSGAHPFLARDAPVVKSREGGRIASVACVQADGRRESLDLERITSEDGAG